MILLFIYFLIYGLLGQIDPEPVNWFHLIWTTVVPIIGGLYEVIVRVIPTFGNYSAIHKVIEILLWLSNFLNNKKK
jgi:hypothetical protein